MEADQATRFPRSQEAESVAAEALFHPCCGLGAGLGQAASLQLPHYGLASASRLQVTFAFI